MKHKKVLKILLILLICAGAIAGTAYGLHRLKIKNQNKKTNKRNKKIVAGSVIVMAILAVVILLVYRYVVGFSLKTNPDD